MLPASRAAVAVRTSWQQLLNSYVGQPKTAALATSIQSGTNATATANDPVSIPNIDLTAAVYFIGVILVGVVFVGTGGLIALRKK